MSEPLIDDPVLAQLRAWADDLADRVPPVAAPTADGPGGARRSGPARRRVLAMAAAVVAVLAVAVVAVAVTGDDGAEDVRAGTTSTSTTTASTTTETTTEPAVADVALEDTTWWLEGITVDGVAREVPLDFVARIGIGVSDCPPGPACQPPAGTPMLGGHDGCNGFSGRVTVTADRLIADGFGGTLMACTGVRGELSNLVTTGLGNAHYVIEGDRLTLDQGSVEAVYRAGPEGYPAVPDGGGVLAEGPAEAPYRATWGPVDGGLRVQVVRPREVPMSAAGIDLPLPATGRMAAAATSGGSESVLVGLVDARAALVTYRWGDTVVEVPTVPLPGRADVRGFTALVDPATMGWRLWATAADGSEVATFVHRP